MLYIRETARVARGFLQQLVLENLQLVSGSIETVRIGYPLGSVAGRGGFGGFGGAGEVVHDYFGIGQPLLDPSLTCHVLVALRSGRITLCVEVADELVHRQAA